MGAVEMEKAVKKAVAHGSARSRHVGAGSAALRRPSCSCIHTFLSAPNTGLNRCCSRGPYRTGCKLCMQLIGVGGGFTLTRAQ